MVLKYRSAKMALAAVGQITSTSSMTHNLEQCRLVIKKALDAGAKVICISIYTILFVLLIAFQVGGLSSRS